MQRQKVVVMEAETREVTFVADLYEDVIAGRHMMESFKIREYEFALHHLLVKPTVSRRNLIALCANDRLVTSEPLSVLLPEVGNAVPISPSGQGSFRYHGYVTGKYLNEIADDERTGLRFPVTSPGDKGNEDDADLLTGTAQEDEGVTKKELFDHLKGLVRSYLTETLSEVRREKEKRLDQFVASEQPQFRPFLDRAKMSLDRLPARPTKRDIELTLYEAKIDGRQDMEKLITQIISESPAHQQVANAQRELVSQFAQAANAQGVSALAEYVCARKAVLSVFEANLGKREDESHEFEAVIHDLIFPMRTTSTMIPARPSDRLDREISNLWLVDERLVFHQLLASDLPLGELRSFLSDSGRRPDIIIFNPAFATTDDVKDLKSVAIVEFKRPGRPDYGPGEERNPIDQVIALARDIRKGTFNSLTGRKQTVSREVMIFAYIVCDVTPKLREMLDERGFTPTPDMKGYYFFNPALNMMTEVISYEKMLRDAQRRNEMFFRQLNMK